MLSKDPGVKGMTLRNLATIAAMAMVLAACGKQRNAREGANEIDPAVASALEDQIMVDPNLTQQNNRFGARGANAGMEAPIPSPGTAGPVSTRTGRLLRAPAPTAGESGSGITLGQTAQQQADRRRMGNTPKSCMAKFNYGMAWATRLPDAFPLYPDAQVAEAAGNDVESCRMRLVSFVSKAPLQTLVDFYYTQAVRNGFDAEHQLVGNEHILGGTRKDGSAYYIVTTGRKDGLTEVDIIVNNGR